MLLLVGSRAAEIIKHGMLGRPCVDWDFIGTYADVHAYITSRRVRFTSIYPEGGGRKMVARGPGLICEFEIAWEGTTARALLDVVLEASPSARGTFRLPTLDQLYTLKLSHRYLKNSPHFWKTLRDVKAFRAAGAKVWDADWLKRREAETYTYKHPKLDVKKEDFFKGDGIDYVYDHDTIHEAVKHLDKPAYTYFKPADSEVMCDKKMFFDAEEHVRLCSVLEEALVLAIERSLVPHPGVLTPRKAFNKALMKVCTSITSGWWREWAWEHHDEVLAMFDEVYGDEKESPSGDGYAERFQRAVERGVVRKLA